MLFVNADDLGFSKDITDRILICYVGQRVHSASAMTFMEDSERAAELSQRCGVEVGLHLNLTQPLTGNRVPETLRAHHQSVVLYLTAGRFNQVLYNPFLRSAFEYVFRAQWEEFCRLYGSAPIRLDGHHHMHLCMNLILSRLVPKGLRVRRNFTFGPGQKNPFNRAYRYMVDRCLASRFMCTDFFFSIEPMDKERLRGILLLSRSADVELMVHPGADQDYGLLMGIEWEKMIAETPV